MKKITIKIENKDIIEKLLANINGNALTHTYTTYEEITNIIKKVEENILVKMLTKKDRIGLIVVSESGEKVAKSYKYKRINTQVFIELGSKYWVITNIQASNCYIPGGYTKIYFNDNQKEKINQYVNNYVNFCLIKQRGIICC